MERGSHRLLEQWDRGGFVVERGLVERLSEISGDFELEDVFIKGQPHPDWVRATFTVDGDERCGTGVRDILKMIDGLGTGPGARLVVFPKGIPADRYTLQVELGGH